MINSNYMKKERLGFNLAIMGIIASGKDTQAKLLQNKYNLQSVGTGLYTRNLLKEKSKNSKVSKNAIKIDSDDEIPVKKSNKSTIILSDESDEEEN